MDGKYGFVERDPLDIDYRVLVEHIPAITYIAEWDIHSATVYTSPQIQQLLGFDQAEWIADPVLWLKQIHPDDRDRVLADLARLRSGGMPIPIEYRMITKSKNVRWFRDSAAVLRNSDGYPQALYGVMLDITNEKELAAALDEAELRLAEAKYMLWEARRPQLEKHEQAVLIHLRRRATDIEIAQALAISERTVRNWLRRIYTKLGVNSRAEALREAAYWKLFDNLEW